MATYCLTHSDDDDWGDARNRFKTRTDADARFAEMRATGQLVRMIRWENNQPTELARAEQGNAAGSPAATTRSEPALAHVQARIREFDGDERFYAAEKAVALAFTQWPLNTDLNQILVKVVVLNRLYSTNVFDVWSTARHILKLAIDERLRSGDISLVDDIAAIQLGEKKRFLLSFSTKYCAWHEPEKFQIFDSLVESMLWEYQKQFAFGTFSREELRSYPRFLRIIDQFKARFNLSPISRKQLDKFLWIEGRQATDASPGQDAENSRMTISIPELLSFVSRHQNDTWMTRVQKQPFQLKAAVGGVEFTPQTGIARFVPTGEVEEFCKRFCDSQSLKTTDYHDTWHSSYMLTLIERFLLERGAVE